MTDADRPPAPERLPDLLADGSTDAAASALPALESAPADERKSVLRSVRGLADERPAAVAPVVPALVPFLTDDERAVRLTVAKTLVAVADADPDAVAPVVSALAARLDDESEFYYVRGRCAEALGYVALERPSDVSSPEILAAFRVGLSFEEAPVRERLAKAIECVALGDPSRLTHHAPRFADHLDDEQALVRYHLASALVVLACADPAAVAPVTDELVARLDDETPQVRGRAVEALGVLGRESEARIPAGELDALREDDCEFVRERAAFAADTATDGSVSGGEFGTVESVRASTADAAKSVVLPDEAAECRECGAPLPPGGPPMCPRCGAPR